MDEHRVDIGEAAALFGLSPATLRWWERTGVLPPPPRTGGRRRYGERELRRVGLAYLCCVLGRMPLGSAVSVVAGNDGPDTWRRAVTDQISRLDRELAELRTARTYMTHLLRCEDDDMTDCPYLEWEVRAHTPRGRLPHEDVVAAARAAGTGMSPASRETGRTGHRESCDETGDGAGESDATPPVCRACGWALPTGPRAGRPRVYCSAACRQRAFRTRRAGA
ncbi:MerR family DNA-binding transcriptional regulator [Streptomyces sp. NPDC020875]|uniref:helix-turn-helix domain-containing protein n=1 Tax=Streptomyces sp. NPDC020875 TaxID=3154898 RepID=UPI0033D2EB2E